MCTGTSRFTGRATELKRIQAFCESAQRLCGGVLLVCGMRGSGKTRLVDQALNCRDEGGCPKLSGELPPRQWLQWRPIQWLRSAFGHDGAGRRSATRSPRRVNRTLLAVPVDPFFPHGHTAAEAKSAKPESDSGEAVALPLIQNVVFALTSELDPRASVRRFGRTLCQRMGFWSYRFSLNGIAWAGTDAEKVLAMAVAMVIAFASALSLGWLLQLFDATLLRKLGAWDVIGAILLWLAISAAGWAFLRHLDLRGLEHMSQRLYDLVHAQQARQHERSEIRHQWRWEGRADRLKLGASALVLAGGFGLLFTGPGALGPLFVASEQLVGIALTLLGGASTYSLSRVRSTRMHTDFGERNRIWMITLLRRYLFLLHRCGLEPVLILDELDKLELQEAGRPGAGGGEVPQQGAGSEPDAKQGAQNPAATAENRLDQFLRAFITFKQSLGAEFLWILIDNKGVYQRLLSDRQGAHDGPGPLATLIRDEVVVGPMDLVALNDLYPQNSGVDYGRLAAAWIDARGLIAGVLRRMEHGSDGATVPRHAMQLARTVFHLSDKHFANSLDLLASDGGDSTQRAGWENLLQREWVRPWVLFGMLDLAARLLRPMEFHLNNVALAELTGALPSLSELKPTDISELKRIGRYLLHDHLRKIHDRDGAYPESKLLGGWPELQFNKNEFGIPDLSGESEGRPVAMKFR